jgi:hypothetical protein
LFFFRGSCLRRSGRDRTSTAQVQAGASQGTPQDDFFEMSVKQLMEVEIESAVSDAPVSGELAEMDDCGLIPCS